MTDAVAPQHPSLPSLEQDIQAVFRQAIAHHQAGQLQEAENLYRALLRIQPTHPEANHNMGILAVQMKRPADGLPYFMAALDARPERGQYWLNYIDALFQAGRSEDARQVLALARQQGLEGNEVEALALRLEGRAQPATLSNAEAWHTLKELLHVAPSSRPNSNLPRKVKPVKPDKPGKKSSSHRGKAPSPHEDNQLRVLFAGGRLAEAAIFAQEMTKRFPLHGFGWKVMGLVFKQMGRSADALAPMQKAAALSQGDAEAYYNLGNTLNDMGRLSEAEASYRKALDIKPDYAGAHNNLGTTLKEQGRLVEAEASYRQALQVKPDSVEVRFNLAQVEKTKLGDENLAALAAIWEAAQRGATRLPDKEAIFLHFALGKIYDDSGDYEKAFPHFLEGNRLKRATFDYDPDRTARLFTKIMHNFDAAAIARLRGGGDSSNLPIFVLGTPRSGTTLTEQIIASHPEVHGAGELPDLGVIMRRDVAGVAFPDNLPLLGQAQLAAWGAGYVAGLRRRAPDARHITDKKPGNFIAAGLIHLILPNAKIIHVNRNPVDACLSCFTNLFTQNQEYTFDLAELGRYYVGYIRLMEHWREVLPEGAFLDVQYEDIVADQEVQSRRIIEYCGLEWNDACIDFHRSKRPVKTASAMQVRQPMYTSSVERWRHYEKFLGPLLDALGNLAHGRQQTR